MKNKKTIILFVMLAYCISFKAQIMQIMKGEKVVATYTASEADKVIFKESPDPSTANHEYVEIGGVKWATMNIGATTVAGSPSTCFGDYFMWGETEPCYTGITIIDANTIVVDGWKSKYPLGTIIIMIIHLIQEAPLMLNMMQQHKTGAKIGVLQQVMTLRL